MNAFNTDFDTFTFGDYSKCPLGNSCEARFGMNGEYSLNNVSNSEVEECADALAKTTSEWAMHAEYVFDLTREDTADVVNVIDLTGHTSDS